MFLTFVAFIHLLKNHVKVCLLFYQLLQHQVRGVVSGNHVSGVSFRHRLQLPEQSEKLLRIIAPLKQQSTKGLLQWSDLTLVLSPAGRRHVLSGHPVLSVHGHAALCHHPLHRRPFRIRTFASFDRCSVGATSDELNNSLMPQVLLAPLRQTRHEEISFWDNLAKHFAVFLKLACCFLTLFCNAFYLVLQVPWLHAIYAVLGAILFTLVRIPLAI